MRAAIRAEFGPAAASPVDAVRPGAPRFLVVQGSCDRVVPAAQSRDFAARLRAAGDAVEYVELAGAGHGLWSCGGGRRPDSVAAVVDRLAAFLSS